MFGLIIVFLLFVGVRLTSDLEFACWGTAGFTSLFSLMIWHQLLEFKKSLNLFACPACAKDSLCEKFCKSTIIYGLFALVLSVVMSLSLLSFLVLMEKFYLLIIGMDMFVFYYLFNHWNSTTITELTQKASQVGAEVAINILNIFLLIVMLVSLELMYIKHVEMSPEIFVNINETVHHSCRVFQHILRTKEFTESSIYAMRNIDDIGNILFAFFYISTLSLFPITAITLLYKFGIKMNYRLTKAKKGTK